MNFSDKVLAAAQKIKAFGKKIAAPDLAVVLGSGLAEPFHKLKCFWRLPYAKIPGFHAAGVGGHKGELACVEWRNRRALLFFGRVHYYEGYSMEEVIFPVECMAALNIKAVALLSAVGAVNGQYRPGDVVILQDHINLMGANPLRKAGANKDPMEFLSLNDCYSPRLQRVLARCAQAEKIRAHSGIYLALSGPTYETPAEIKAFRAFGADVVGMSMVPEALGARRRGMEVAGLALVTNLAAGLDSVPPAHKEVLEQAALSGQKVFDLLDRAITEF